MTVQEVAALLRKEQLNSYGIMATPGENGERRLRGGGIYPGCSLINHECIPNVVRFDAFDALLGHDNSCVQMRALHDLPAGTEVVQSYFPLNWEYPERQEQAQKVSLPAEHHSCRGRGCYVCPCRQSCLWQQACTGGLIVVRTAAILPKDTTLATELCLECIWNDVPPPMHL